MQVPGRCYKEWNKVHLLAQSVYDEELDRHLAGLCILVFLILTFCMVDISQVVEGSPFSHSVLVLSRNNYHLINYR
jgi:hypothetical protein